MACLLASPKIQDFLKDIFIWGGVLDLEFVVPLLCLDVTHFVYRMRK